MIAAVIIAKSTSGSSPGGSAPVASFSTSDPNPLVGEVIVFTDTSTNSPTAWQWTVDGNVYSTGSSFSYYANSVGYITIGLTSSNQFGSDSTSTQYYVENPRL